MVETGAVDHPFPPLNETYTYLSLKQPGGQAGRRSSQHGIVGERARVLNLDVVGEGTGGDQHRDEGRFEEPEGSSGVHARDKDEEDSTEGDQLHSVDIGDFDIRRKNLDHTNLAIAAWERDEDEGAYKILGSGRSWSEIAPVRTAEFAMSWSAYGRVVDCHRRFLKRRHPVEMKEQPRRDWAGNYDPAGARSPP